MTVNALIGYLMVEVFAITARALDLMTTSDGSIILLASIANCTMILFIIIIYFKKTLVLIRKCYFFPLR